MTAKQRLLAHLKTHHPQLQVRAKSTLAELIKQHSEAHWRYGRLGHNHGPNYGPDQRPEGWRTGEVFPEPPRRPTKQRLELSLQDA